MSEREHELGVGFYFDGDFDMTPNGYGDIESADGIQKLGSDLSWFLINGLQEFVGVPDDLGVREQVRVRTREIIIADERVNEVLDPILVEYVNSPRTIRVTVELDTVLEDGSTELDFDVREI